jgi:hypothetical protein
VQFQMFMMHWKEMGIIAVKPRKRWRWYPVSTWIACLLLLDINEVTY